MKSWPLALLVLLGVGCKTPDTEPAASPSASAASLSNDELATPSPVPPRDLERGDAAATVGDLRGYDFDGPATCPPLAKGATCLAAASRQTMNAACTRVGGKVLQCEDCAVLCDKGPVNP